jgi:hypothetical protein
LTCDQQSGAGDHEDNTGNRRQVVAVFGRNTDVNVARVEAVMFIVRERNEEREYS